ncbi:hypothetical protein HPP92_015906 [Vanilla planifolia]|uniref:Exoribonuclease phosphorolytic domain-containing protein n=1 Tax=Vanilla planifolia TaxID=51239 RepID=A0A835QIZ3_VANPL|nr:hypothetical protein HPP92_015906 [Vanilla planifolia]
MATGPTSSYSPSQSMERRQKQQRNQTFHEIDWTRLDGRHFHQCRPAFLKTGVGNAASGSAYAEFGSTKVIVSVFGPRESKKAMMFCDFGRLNCHVSYTNFSTPTRGQGFESKQYSSILHKALEGAIILESFPKTTVDVFALVLESGGRIMMYDVVSSVSLSCFGKNLVIDPSSEEEACQDGSLMVTYMPSRNEITQFTLTGEWSTAKMNEAWKRTVNGQYGCGPLKRRGKPLFIFDLSGNWRLTFPAIGDGGGECDSSALPLPPYHGATGSTRI